jgi:GNAT superfamily N-acetyltransferase
VNIEIIPFDPSLKDELVEFRRRNYETGFPESRDYLEWKYEQNPYIKGPIYYLARVDGRIVGMRGIYGTCWEHDRPQQATILPCADDWAVDREFRNRGVASLIMREAVEDLSRRGYEYVVNTSGGRITVVASIAAGWRSATPLEPVVRRSRDERMRHMVRTRLRGVRGAWRFIRSNSANVKSSDEPFRRIDQMETMRGTLPGSTIVAESKPRIDSMAGLIARLPYDGRIRHVRGTRYLTWRYKNPIRAHRFLYHERDGQLEGYLVLACWPECQLPTLPFHIVDWEGSDDTVRADLLHCAVETAQISELGMWTAGLSAQSRAVLDEAGFVKTDLDQRERGMPCILVKQLGRETPIMTWMLGDGSILDGKALGHAHDLHHARVKGLDL